MFIFSATFLFILLYVGYMHKLNVVYVTGFVAQSFKILINQESLYYIRPSDFRFVGLFYSLKVLTYLLH